VDFKIPFFVLITAKPRYWNQVLFLYFLLSVSISFAQSPDIPLNRDYYNLIDRYEILSGKFSNQFHSAVKPYRREQVAAFFDGIDTVITDKSRVDLFNIEQVRIDNYAYSTVQNAKSKKRFLKYFYEHKNDLFSVMEKDFEMHVNPVLYFSAGIDKDQHVTPYVNTRGIEVSGMISKKIGYYTFISTTQAAYPNYVRSWINSNLAVPYEGFWKAYNKDGVDFFTASGYFSFNVVKPVNIRFGHGKTIVGNGIRSMTLSDFSNNYLYLKLDVKVWKFDYFSLFAQNYADAYAAAGTGSLGGNYPKKFLAHHHLSYNINRNLNIGIFESVVIGDSTQSFEIGYLNPLIFYRALEQQSGSNDNAILGGDIKFNFLKHVSIYGQFLLDEFKLDEVLAGNGWWANKYGAQGGIKYINAVGIKNLDAQVEFNISRPYTYTHSDIYTNYANYRMPLAHPFGANFKELIMVIRYQPFTRITWSVKGIYAKYGEDDATSNWGKNIMKSYNTRERDYGNFIGQGYMTSFNYFNFITSYQFKFNVFFDLELAYRDVNCDYEPLNNRSFYAGANFRWNIPRKEFDF
jgi:hypothetical protein